MQRPLEHFPVLLMVSAAIHVLAGILLWTSFSGPPPVAATSEPGFAVLSLRGGSSSEKNPEDSDEKQSSERDGETDRSEEKGGPPAQQGLLTETIGNLKQAIPYPPLARSQEIQGTVVVSIRLNKGNLESVNIVRSSGYSILDNQVLSSLRGWQWPDVSGERTFDVVFEIVR